MSVYNKNGIALNAVYDKSGAELQSAYNKSGEVIFTASEPQYDYDDYSITNLFSLSGSNYQGFAVYDGKIAQARENYALYIVDIATGTKIKEVSMDMGHGNSCQFSDEFYSESDEFPLFYIRNDGVWVYRITGTASTLVKKYSFSSDVIGTYVASFGIDTEHRKFYTASYTEGTYESKTGRMRICVFDMDDVTDLGDNVYSMALLDSNDFDWFTKYDAIQGSCFHDGYFFISCGLPNTQQYVVLVDKDTLTIAHEVTTGNTTETEGCAWVGNDYMIIGQNPSNIAYKKVTFAELS